jgi:CHAT domain-containing protein
VTELACIQKHAGAPFHYTQLDESDATTSAVLDAMEMHSWVHLACHAHQNIDDDDPTMSGFYLRDGTLSLAKISQKAFKNKGLAFLSACRAATSRQKPAEEAMHLASGMVAAGYPSVIATMWPIAEEDAPLIVDSVYGQLLKDGRMEYRDAAKALHVAVGELRLKVGDKAFARWIPFVHIGV